MKKYLWCSVHAPINEQLTALPGENKQVLHLVDVDKELFEELCDLKFNSDLGKLAEKLITIALSKNCTIVQPSGSPKFQMELGRIRGEMQTYEMSIAPPSVLYAFSKRVSVDKPQSDGSVVKVSTFNFEGWH